MFLGYGAQHAGDVYWILHLKTIPIICSQDVQWLAKSGMNSKMFQAITVQLLCRSI